MISSPSPSKSQRTFFEHERAAVRLDLAAGRVVTPHGTYDPAPREAEILYALGGAGAPVAIADLCSLVWGNVRSCKHLHVSVHRIRTKSETRDLIASAGSTYRLGDGVSCDLWSVERFVRDLESAAAHGSDGVEQLRRVWAHLWDNVPSPALGGRAAVERVQRRLSAAKERIARWMIARLAVQAEADEILPLAELAIAADPCDELPRELKIRAYLSQGHRERAFRELDAYRKKLRNELQLEPSPALQRLVVSDAAF